MSLKTIHIIFLIASLTLAAIFGKWAYTNTQPGDNTTYLAITIAATTALLIYATYFLRKIATK